MSNVLNTTLLLIVLISFVQIFAKDYSKEVRSIYDNKIANLVDKYRTTLARGAQRLTPLDPMPWQGETIHYADNENFIDLEFSFDSVIKGFTRYTVANVKTTDENDFEITLKLDHSSGSGKVSAKGQIGKNLPVTTNQDVNYTATAYDQQFIFRGQIGTNETGNMYFKKFEVPWTFNRFNCRVSGLTGGAVYDSLVSLVFSAGTTIVQKANPAFFYPFSTNLYRDALEPLIQKYTLEQLYDFIENA